MQFASRPDRAPLAAWPDLVEELDRWGEAGRIAEFWWRDDDAATATQLLFDLLALAPPVPLALAVIPELADDALAAAVTAAAHVHVLQHGWGHINHGGAGKKSEFPAGRPAPQVAEELAAGQRRLAALFGRRALPALAPPWNRFADDFLPLLFAAGITALSRAQPRRSRSPAPGVVEVNVHVDLVAWKAGGGFIGEDAALGGLVAHLAARRQGAADADEPTGILTHHLVGDAATGDFLRRLTALLGHHPAARWVDAAELFAPSAPLHCAGNSVP
jgi:hypothetical protein